MRRAEKPAGFTLVELILSIGLLVVLSTLLLFNFESLQGGLKNRGIEAVLRETIREGHAQARSRKEAIRLYHDRELNMLLLVDTQGRNVLANALGPSDPDLRSDFRLTFYRTLPEREMDGEPAYEAEEEESHILVFHPSGCSGPTSIELSDKQGTRLWQLDPFSGELSQARAL